MTTRERILAVLNGEEYDRIPILQYDNLIFPNESFWEKYGRENVGVLHRCGMTKAVGQMYSVESYECVEGCLRVRYSEIKTSKGTLRDKTVFDPALNSPAKEKHFVSTPEEYAVLLEYLNDQKVVEDVERYTSCLKYVGDDGIPMICSNRTPFQQMWVAWVSLEDLCIDIVEHEDVVVACLERLMEIEVDKLKMLAYLQKDYPFEIFNVPDNITAHAIGRKYFREYCIPFYNKAREYVDTPIISVHIDGEFKALADDIINSEVTAIESYTPPPISDMTVTQSLAMRDTMRLFMNFTSSVHIKTHNEIYDHTIALLNEGEASGRMWLQFSEDIPPDRREANIHVIIKAVNDYYEGKR